MRKTVEPAMRGFFLLIAFLMISHGALSAIDGYSDPVTVNKRIEQIRQSSPALVKVHKMAVTPGGREMLMLEIGKSGSAMPSVLVAANMSGTNPLATEAALSLASRIVADPKMQEGHTWYILPLGNPDACARYFLKPLYLDAGNGTPFNDDTDELTDEDGYNDLNGDGIITQMRVKAPDGTWIPVEGEPRLMRKAEAVKGEKGIYKLYTEGIDDDGDGKYNEDAIGGTDVNINFPHLFKSFGRRSGLFPGSTPEAEALIKFAFKHPELAMVISFGKTNFLLSPPQGGRQGSYDAENIRIPEEIGKQMGFDASRRYTMSEIIELVQPMMPPGMTADESMIAGFLGLGAVVNPMKEDLDFYNEISSNYKEYLKKKGVTAERFDPAQPEDGSFELWAYYHLGLPVFTMDLWGVPKPKEEKKEGSGVTVEALEKMSSSEFLELGEDKITAFLKERGAPEQYNAKMAMTMVRNGQVSPAQMAGMIKQMPAPKSDGKKGDPKETALLAFLDSHTPGQGFVEWKPFTHPTLGEVEIGGFVPFTDNTPPASMADSLLDLHLPYIAELVSRLPVLQLAEVKATDKGGGVYEIEAWVANSGYLPWPTAMGRRNKAPAPAILILEGEDLKILSGYKRTPVNAVGGMKSEKHTWLIVAPKRASVTLKLESSQAGRDTKRINIGG